MRPSLRASLKRQAFFPTWIGVFVNPFFFARRGLAREIRRFSPMLCGSLLDVGCGNKPYRCLFDVEEYVGLDIDSADSRARGIADYFYDGVVFPFESESFDSVLCNQVLEHVFNPDVFLSEIHRVLTRDGMLLLTVPFVWDEHEVPFDYARYSSYGLKSLLKKNGFSVIEQEKIGADATIFFQLVNAYLYRMSAAWPRHLKMLFTIAIMGPINVMGIFAAKFLPKNPALFLDQLVIAEKE